MTSAARSSGPAVLAAAPSWCWRRPPRAGGSGRRGDDDISVDELERLLRRRRQHVDLGIDADPATVSARRVRPQRADADHAERRRAGLAAGGPSLSDTTARPSSSRSARRSPADLPDDLGGTLVDAQAGVAARGPVRRAVRRRPRWRATRRPGRPRRRVRPPRPGRDRGRGAGRADELAAGESVGPSRRRAHDAGAAATTDGRVTGAPTASRRAHRGRRRALRADSPRPRCRPSPRRRPARPAAPRLALIETQPVRTSSTPGRPVRAVGAICSSRCPRRHDVRVAPRSGRGDSLDGFLDGYMADAPRVRVTRATGRAGNLCTVVGRSCATGCVERVAA